MYIALVNNETREIQYAEEYDETREATKENPESGADELARNARRLFVEAQNRNAGAPGPWRLVQGAKPFSFEAEDAKRREAEKAGKKAEIIAHLSALDTESIPALRDLAINPDDSAAREELRAIESQALTLRIALKELEASA
jgi:hypothetical protein